MQNTIFQNHTSLKTQTILFIIRYKKYLLALVCIAILVSIFEISIDYKIKEIVDNIAYYKGNNLNYLIALFVFYKLAYHVMFFIMGIFDIKYKPIIIGQTIANVYNKATSHSLHWFDSNLSGAVSSKIVDFQNSISALVNHFFVTVRTISVVFIVLWFLSNISMLPTLVLMVFIVLYTPLVYWLLKKQMYFKKLCVVARQDAIGVINDSIANIFVVKIIGNLLTEFKLKLEPAVNKWIKWDRKTRKFETYVAYNISALVAVLINAVQVFLLTYLYRNSRITPGDFVFATIATLKIHIKLTDFLEYLLREIIPSLAQLKASYAFINIPLDVQDNPRAGALQNVQGMIKYLNVNFSYTKKDKLVLSDFNIDIKPRERVGIVGISGAGKTTLIKCLLRYFDINSGIISIDGVNIKNISQESLRSIISIIPQDITMFHRSIKANLQLAKYDASDMDIINACKKARIHSDILRMSNGYDTVVGERGIKLSGGQRQRIAIARAILKDAPILILDEATNSLDAATEQLIQESLNEILENNAVTVIAIAHRLSTLRHMDRIIVLGQGKIIEEGTHNRLIRKRDGLYKQLWEMQAI